MTSLLLLLRLAPPRLSALRWPLPWPLRCPSLLPPSSPRPLQHLLSRLPWNPQRKKVCVCICVFLSSLVQGLGEGLSASERMTQYMWYTGAVLDGDLRHCQIHVSMFAPLFFFCRPFILISFPAVTFVLHSGSSLIVKRRKYCRQDLGYACNRLTGVCSSPSARDQHHADLSFRVLPCSN